MSRAAEIVFDGADGRAELLTYRPQCVERAVLGLGSTWVHGYTGHDAGRWKRLAANLCTEVPEAKGKDGAPTLEALRFAQCVVVCRQGPGSDAHTFRVDFNGALQAWSALRQLPGSWVENVCRESDALTLMEYRRPEGEPLDDAMRALHELLGDAATWAALDHLVAKLFGHSLMEDGRPLAQVLTLLDRDAEVRAGVAAGLAPLAALVS